METPPGETPLPQLAAELVRIDSRSSVSNIAVAERIEAELAGFDVERLDYTDAAGVPKRALVARKGGPGGIALSGHMDTVPATGWTDDPWSGRIAEGVLHGLGAVDMKGAVAACIVAARRARRATLLITTDEETTKLGARIIAETSILARGLEGIVVAEPTGLAPVRGHRSSVHFVATARGVQAHSSTGQGVNANWAMIGFLAEMRAIHERLRSEPALQNPAYDPPFSDFNLVVDNHGTAVNVTVAEATCRIKFRRTAGMDSASIVRAVRDAAHRAGMELREDAEGEPPELPADHPLVRRATAATGRPAQVVPYGTDASELQGIAPCVVLGPGGIGTAHTPRECVRLADLEAAIPLFLKMLDS
ncbi:MAG: M20/M25/M40 family metallo-hydrolase [Acetobacteraceae bacterium]|nr:M20/M25/M40 family metallo-hydrolase [Acetobacteraceae bacterium]